MLKRLLWLSVIAAAGWLVWRWLQSRNDDYGHRHPQLAPSVPLDHPAPPATVRPSPPREEEPRVAPAPAPPSAGLEGGATSYTAYCNHCRTKRPVVGGSEETTSNGRRAVRGTCAVCGKSVFAFLPQNP